MMDSRTPRVIRELLERFPGAKAYGPVPLASLPPVNQDCTQCRDDEGRCTCTMRCQSIVCARGPWDDGEGEGRVSVYPV
jgi:hypothetical protein